MKIDVAIADDQLDEVIDVISKAAYTGKLATAKFSSLNCSASFASVPAKLTKRHCNFRPHSDGNETMKMATMKSGLGALALLPGLAMAAPAWRTKPITRL